MNKNIQLYYGQLSVKDADDLEAISAYSRLPGLQSLLITFAVALFLKVLRIKELIFLTQQIFFMNIVRKLICIHQNNGNITY
jgi:hypothetical protein